MSEPKIPEYLDDRVKFYEAAVTLAKEVAWDHAGHSSTACPLCKAADYIRRYPRPVNVMAVHLSKE